MAPSRFEVTNVRTVPPPMRDHTLDTTASDPSSEAPVPGQGLRPDQTFVVQLREPSAAASDELAGRVEHVISGEALRFGTTAELVAFLRRSGLGSTPAANSSRKGTA